MGMNKSIVLQYVDDNPIRIEVCAFVYPIQILSNSYFLIRCLSVSLSRVSDYQYETQTAK